MARVWGGVLIGLATFTVLTVLRAAKYAQTIIPPNLRKKPRSTVNSNIRFHSPRALVRGIFLNLTLQRVDA
jgi:hypothetical protein